jgi:hypothetical protein
MSASSEESKSDSEKSNVNKHDNECYRRAKKWLCASLKEPNNFPVYLTAFGTFLLAFLALLAWRESLHTTAELRRQIVEQTDDLRVAQRGALIITNWETDRPAAGQAPIKGFDVVNVGHTHAFVLSGTYEYAVNDGLPQTFMAKGDLPGLAATIAEGDKNAIVLADLPRLTPVQFEGFKSNRLAAYARVIIIYRDIFCTQFRLTVTARYRNAITKTGKISPSDRLPRYPLGPEYLGDLTTIRSPACATTIPSNA